MVRRVSVYCASSSQVDEEYKRQAYLLGKIMAENGVEAMYGSGSVGLMGAFSKGVIEHHGTIIGVIPQFMVDEGWGNSQVTEQIVTQTMHERKKRMTEGVDAAIAMPGGCGTLEELLEVITWKQLGLYHQPIIILNVNHYYDDLLRMMDKAVSEKFMRGEHREMWRVVSDASEVLPAIENAPMWHTNARKIAAM